MGEETLGRVTFYHQLVKATVGIVADLCHDGGKGIAVVVGQKEGTDVVAHKGD